MRQVVLYPDLEDGGFVAEVPSLPGCVSQGETRQQAIENIREAIDLWIKTAKRMKIKVPPDKLEAHICVV